MKNLKFKIQNLKLRGGFTYLELIIVVALLAITAVIALPFIGNFLQTSELSDAAKQVASDVQSVRAKAIAGLDSDGDDVSDNWGICFRNPSGAADYYEIISPTDDIVANCKEGVDYTPSTTAKVRSTVYLPAGISFSSPGAGATKVVIFNKISGTTTAGTETNVVLASATGSTIITINIQGLVFISSVSVSSISCTNCTDTPLTGASKANSSNATGVTITGNGFVSGAVATLVKGSTTITCTGFTITEMSLTGGTCPLTTSTLGGYYSVFVTNPAGASGSLTNGFFVDASAPSVSSIVPSSGVNTDDVSVEITGSNFQSGVTAKLSNGQNIPCDVTGTPTATTINANCRIEGVSASSGWVVKVTNTGGDGDESLETNVTFRINNPTPTISSISPSSATAGDSALTLTVTNTDGSFNRTSVVKYDGTTTRATTYISANQLSIQLSAADLSAAGTHTITVTNTTPCVSDSCTSGDATFTINPGAESGPVITSINPATGVRGSTNIDFLDIVGTGFSTTANDISVKISKGAEVIVCTSFVVPDSAHINDADCIIPATATVATDWTVKVTNIAGDDTTSCVAPTTACAFEVTAGGLGITKIVPSKIESDSGMGANQPIIAVYGANFTASSAISITDGTTTRDCAGFTYLNPTLLVNGKCDFSGLASKDWQVKVTDGTTFTTTCPGEDCVTVRTAPTLFIDCLTAPDTNFYWVGGTGNWSTTSLAPKWALTSGGSASATAVVPCAGSTVYFDRNSFSADGQTVTINAAGVAKNITFSDIDVNVIIAGSNTLNVAGSANFTDADNTVETNNTGTMTFSSTTAGDVLIPAADSLPALTFNGSGGSWTLGDAITSTGAITLTTGTLDTNNKNISATAFSMGGGTLNLGSTQFTGTGGGTFWSVTSGTVNAGTSTIKTTASAATGTFAGGGKTYNNVTFDNGTTAAISGAGNVFNDLDFNNGGTVTLSDGLTAHNVTFDNTGNTTVTINGTNTFNGTVAANNAAGAVTLGGNSNRFNSTVTFNNTGLTTISNSNTFVGAVSSDGRMAIGNSNTFSGALDVAGTGASTVGTGNTFAQNVTLAGSTTISGHAESPTDETVCTNSTTKNTFSGTLGISGSGNNLIINGSCNIFTGAVSVASGVLTMNADMNRNKFNATPTSFTASISTSGSAVSSSNTFAGVFSVAGSATVEGSNLFNGTMSFGGTVTINGASNDFGNDSADTLTLSTGNLVFTATNADSNEFQGAVNISSGVLTLNSGATDNHFYGALTASTSTSASKISTSNIFDGAVTIRGYIDSSPSPTSNQFNAALTVQGSTSSAIGSSNTFSGAVSFTAGAVSIGAANSFSDALNIDGTGTSSITGDGNTFAGAVTIDGPLNMTGGSNTFGVSSTVNIAGSATISSNNNFNGTGNTVSCSSTSVNVCVSGSGASSIAGSNTFAGAIKFSNTGSSLAISGSSNTFSSSLIVSGTGSGTSLASGNTFNGTVTISGSSPTVNGPNTWGASSSLELNGTGTAVITGANTGVYAFKNFTRTASASLNDNGITFPASTTQTVSGTLTLAGASGATRLFVSSATPGTRAVVSAGAVSLSNADFKDIDADGAVIPWTGSSLGNVGNNLDITFSDPVTRYWIPVGGNGSGNWSDGTHWSNSSGGSACTCIPLPQDIARFDASSITSSGRTVTIDVTRLSAMDFTGVANSPTLAFGSTARTIYGSQTNDTSIITFVSGMSLSGTGTLTFGNAGIRKTVTSGGRTFTVPIDINTTGGTVTFSDAFSSSNTLALSAGTLTANNIAVTASKLTASSGTTLNMGSGTWTVTGTGTAGTAPWNVNSGVTLTSASGGKITMSGSGSKDFNGGGKTCVSTCTSRYRDLEITGSGATTIDNGNRFNAVSSTAGALTFGSSADNISTVDSTFSYTGGSSSVTLNGSNTYTGNVTISGTSTTVSVAHTGNTFSGSASFNNTGATTVSGGSNVFTGAVNVAGSLTLNGNSNTFGSSVAVTGTANIAGSSNQFNGTSTVSCSVGSVTISSVCIGGAVTIAAGSNTFASTFTTTGSAGVNFSTSLSDANIFSGAVTLGGALTMASGADGNEFNDATSALTALGTGSSTVSASNTFAGAVSFGGATTIGGAAASALCPSALRNSFGSTLTLTTGSLTVNGSCNIFTGKVTMSSGGLTMNTNMNTNTFSGAPDSIAASGSFTSSISASNTFAGTMAFGGATTISGGSNDFGNDVSDTFSITGAGDLSLESTSSNNEFRGPVSIANGIISINTLSTGNEFESSLTASTATGTSFLSHSNTFTGAVSLAGRLYVGNSNTFSSTFTVSGTGAATASISSNTFNGAVSISNSGVTIGTNTWNTGANLTLNGTGTTTVNAANTFKNFTYSSTGGTLAISSSNAYSNFTITSPSGKNTINFTANTTQTVAGKFIATGVAGCLGATTCTVLTMVGGSAPLTDRWFISAQTANIASDIRNLNVSKSTASGAATDFVCSAVAEALGGENCNDGLLNTGWTF